MINTNNKIGSIQIEVVPNQNIGTEVVAMEIANLIRNKKSKGEQCLLGLATGASPIKIYQELIRLHREEGLSFSNVVTFNLDEYCGLLNEDEQSYHYFMYHHLFNHIDIPKENIHIPNGLLEGKELEDHCLWYEEKIEALGGLDFQLLGIGRTGHIGFNEPGSSIDSKTKIVHLNEITIEDAGPAFNGKENVPKTAVTMGVSTVLKAKRIVLLAWGVAKASIVNKAINGEISSEIPATFLQYHHNTTFVLDEDSASELED